MNNLALKHLLLGDQEPSNGIYLDVSETRDDLQRIHDKIIDKVEVIDKTSWDGISKEIFAQLDKLLDISVGFILARSWIKLRDVKKNIQRQKETGSDDVALIPLTDHKIKSTHNPKLEILINEEVFATLALTIEVSLNLSSIMLVVQQGKLSDIKTGSCKGNGVLNYGKERLLEKKIVQFDLPGNIALYPKTEEQQREWFEESDQLSLFEEKVHSEEEVKHHKYAHLWLFLGALLVLLAVVLWK